MKLFQQLVIDMGHMVQAPWVQDSALEENNALEAQNHPILIFKTLQNEISFKCTELRKRKILSCTIHFGTSGKGNDIIEPFIYSA